MLYMCNCIQNRECVCVCVCVFGLWRVMMMKNCCWLGERISLHIVVMQEIVTAAGRVGLRTSDQRVCGYFVALHNKTKFTERASPRL